MEFYMPTKVFMGDLFKNKEEFNIGKKAFIVTGKSSSKNNSLNDVKEIMESFNIDYVIFDEVEENPSLENIYAASQIGMDAKVDFIIGLGGGSPLDASKAIGVAIKNNLTDMKELQVNADLKSLPVLAIPTTAGTGSETTQYAILTDHEAQTKASMKPAIFPDKAFLNYKYLESLPISLLHSTVIDALCHTVEGLLTVNSNPIIDNMAYGNLIKFRTIKENMIKNDFDKEFYENIITASTVAGMIIATSQTSVAHAFSYSLTYYKGVKHGYACGLFLPELLRVHKNQYKKDMILSLLGFNSIDELEEFLQNAMIMDLEFSQDDVDKYIDKILSNKAKLSRHPDELSNEQIREMHMNSLKNYMK